MVQVLVLEIISDKQINANKFGILKGLVMIMNIKFKLFQVIQVILCSSEVMGLTGLMEDDCYHSLNYKHEKKRHARKQDDAFTRCWQIDLLMLRVEGIISAASPILALPTPDTSPQHRVYVNMDDVSPLSPTEQICIHNIFEKQSAQ